MGTVARRGLRLAIAGATALAFTGVGHAPDAHAVVAVTCSGHAATIVGTEGPDTINGTSGPDVIAGLGGDDRIDGAAGDDIICGGAGNDVIQGSLGNDQLSGQGDNDTLYGNIGDDYLDGGEGGCCNVATNSGDDKLYGGDGNDTLHTSDFPVTGNELYGEVGNDTLYLWSGGLGSGGTGDDVLYQYTKNATMSGDSGNDQLTNWDDGGANAESVSMDGGTGDDQLVNQDASGATYMNGAGGTDVCDNGTTETKCEA
jgi:Ca2+-binding RTX toxin-like protein